MNYSGKLEKVRGIVPNFDDPKAVIREYTDSAGELQKIEIFMAESMGATQKATDTGLLKIYMAF